MKPDYKNWIPKGMLVSLIAGTVLSLALLLVFGVFGIGVGGKLRIVSAAGSEVTHNGRPCSFPVILEDGENEITVSPRTDAKDL